MSPRVTRNSQVTTENGLRIMMDGSFQIGGDDLLQPAPNQKCLDRRLFSPKCLVRRHRIAAGTAAQDLLAERTAVFRSAAPLRNHMGKRVRGQDFAPEIGVVARRVSPGPDVCKV